MGLKLVIFAVMVSSVSVALFHAVEDPCIKLGKKLSDQFVLARASPTLPVVLKFALQPPKE